jgi:hypothetical protein
MRQVLDNEKALLDAWVLYLDENKPAAWPAELVEKHIAESEKAMARFAHVPADIQYPADDMVRSFRSALGDMLQVQRTALDEYNFEARQSAKHGNEVYLQLHNHFNNALLSFTARCEATAGPPTASAITRRPRPGLPLRRPPPQAGNVPGQALQGCAPCCPSRPAGLRPR